MAKTKVEQRSISVSTEYGHFHADRDAIYAAIGCDLSVERKSLNGIEVTVQYEKVGFWPNEKLRVACVRLSFRSDIQGCAIGRRVNVKDGTLNLSQIDQKIAELVALTAADEERSRIQLEEAYAKREARQKVESEAEAAGLSFKYWNVTPRPIVSWNLQADLTLAVDKHQGLSIEQAIQVQQLIASFAENG